jgi:ADP-heptose:LPS heptosyltransferase
MQGELKGVNVPIAAGLKPAELAAVLSCAHAVIGNDSGVTQLAAALGVKTIAIFGSTDSAVWAPRGPRVRVLQGSAGNMETVSVSHVVRELGL